MLQQTTIKKIMKDLLDIFDDEIVNEQIANVTPDPPKKTKEDLQEDLIIKYMEEYGITNDYVKAAMMGIIVNEGGFKGIAEDMYYKTPGRLAEVFSVFSTYKNSRGKIVRAPEGEGSKYANELAKSGKYLRNPQALGNFVYANVSGNEGGTDGYRYRGRGPNQITGKGAYKKLGEELGVDLVNNPELLETDPDIQAKAAVKFLYNRLAKELPYLTKKYNRYKKRFGNYVDFNNIDNIEDANFILTSANAGFGKIPKQKTFTDRLTASKKYEKKYVQPDEERWQDEFEVDSQELAADLEQQKTEVESTSSSRPIPEMPKIGNSYNADIDDPQLNSDNDISPLAVNIPESVNTIPPNLSSPETKFINSNVQNFSKKELKQQEAYTKMLSESIMKNSAIPQFGQGSMFGQGQLFGANKKKYGGNIYPSRKLKLGGPDDPMKFMVDPETDNIKTYNFDTGKYEVSNTPYEGDFSGMMSHVSDIYEQDDESFEAAAARAEKANYLAKLSEERTKGAQNQIAERSIRNLGKYTWEQGSPFKNFLNSIGGARCITGSSCNLSPTPGDSDEPEVENLARVPYYIQDKKGNWIPNKPYTKTGRQKVGVSPSVAEQNAAPKGGIPGGPIPVVTGNQSFASRYKNFGMEMQKPGVLPQPGDIQVLHGFEEKEWIPNDFNNIQRGNTDTGYWRRKKKPDGSPVFTNGRFVYGLPGNSNHAQTIGPYLDQEVSDYIGKKHSETPAYYIGDYSADNTKLTRTDNPGGGRYDFVGKVDPNSPTYPGTATMRYKGDNKMFQNIATDAAKREMDAFDSMPISRLNIKPIENISTNYTSSKELPSEFLKRFRNRPYATGGSLGSSPCPSGQIYDETSQACVSYETWEKNNSGFNIEDVKKENENYFNANEWFKNYHNSPKYYEMTRSSYPKGGVGDMQASILRKRREQNLKNIPPLKILPQEERGLAGLSHTDSGQIEVFPEGFETGTATHELSHSTDRPVYFYPGWEDGEQRIIPKSDSKYIDKRKADVLGDSREYFNYKQYYDDLIKNDPEAFRQAQEEFLNFSNYVAEDTETRARLNTIRKLAQEQGIYDPFTEGVSPDLYYQKLKKLKLKTKDRYKQGYNPMKQLQDTFSDEEIIWMLNNISENKTNNIDDSEGMA